MGPTALTTAHKRPQPPWYWLLALVLAAGLGTWLILANAQSRMDQNRRQFASAQLLRLTHMEQRVDDYFGKAQQLVTVGAETMSDVQPGNLEAARRLVMGLYRARADNGVFGVGPFYAPFAFNPHWKLVSIYDHAWDTTTSRHASRFDHLQPDGVDEVGYVNYAPTPADDYTRYAWYREAVLHAGQIVYEGPYVEDNHSFISTVKAFYKNGKLLGVMAVDSLTQRFVSALALSTNPGDVAWMESSYNAPHFLLGTAALPPNRGARMETAVNLLRIPTTSIHLSSDQSALLDANRRLYLSGLGLVVVLWALAGLLAGGIVQRWRADEARSGLERERVRLESELDVGRKVAAELRKAAYTDALTGLPNRAAFLERAGAAIASATDVAEDAVFFIDLDRFNLINDTLGHFTGDEVLKTTAFRLRDALQAEASIFRLGGDEFVVLMPVSPHNAGAVADRILRTLREPLLLRGRITYTGASIGIVCIDADYAHPEELLRDVDIAMYAAKRAGRGCYAIFDTHMRSQVAAESDLENALRRAIERNEFVPHYQPIVSTKTGKLVGLEALARWYRPGSGVVGAAEFVGFAERHGLIDAIDTIVLQAVCRDVARFADRLAHLNVAVNVSAAHLTKPGLAQEMGAILKSAGVEPERIKVEITETAIMTNADVARATVEELRANHLRIVLDDFGTGHSSLAYLNRLPIEGLKIDRSFVEPLVREPRAVAIVRGIVALAQNLELYTVAEGVETREQLDLLTQLGVPFAQGFFFSPALSFEDMLEYASEPSAS